jgi:mannose-6-phosphate isomerase-like protein (cupin superfamily)
LVQPQHRKHARVPRDFQRRRGLSIGCHRVLGWAPWRDEPPEAGKPAAKRDYETVGYVIAGRAELTLEGQTLRLESPGDAWLVPAGAEHAYRILEPFTAVEATAPPAQVHGRDERSS